MSNKNPYEIRAELLSLAKDILDRQYDTNMTFFHATFESALQAGKVAVDQWDKYAPQMYSTDELMKKAQELYGFVSKKD